jgi:hypothetical protein
MSLPEKIKILSVDYTIKRPDKTWIDDTEARGNCDSNEQIINIPATGKVCQTLDTTVHEVFHAIFDAMQLTDKDEEEAYVSRMSTGFVTVLRDNPKFRKWVWDSLKKLDK